MRYRPDIDGLRGVAVSSVVLFHAHIPGFSGGFVGVDIFFVISGFLITGIICEKLKDGTFTFEDFYVRRIRRIFPALFVVYVVSFFAGLALSMPDELKAFGKSLITSATFVSNLHFYDQSGYFDAPSLSKPLLHTWSLSVEEQFYVLWPVAMVLLWRFVRPALWLPILLAGMLVSVIYAEWQLGLGNQSAAFYMPLARAWELLAGAALALTIARLRITGRVRECMAACGLVLIAAAIVGLSEVDSFPGLTAGIPCLGTLLLIAAGHQQAPALSRFYAHPVLVFAGLISYSLYLWHWPVLSYWHQLTPGRLVSIGEAMVLIGLSIALATLSQRYVEKPFRNVQLMPQLPPLRTAVAAMCVFIVAGVLTREADGFPQRFNASASQILDTVSQGVEFRRCSDDPMPRWTRIRCKMIGQSDRSENPSVLLIGDSHAEHFSAALHTVLASRNLSGQVFTRAGCPPLLDARTFERMAERRECDFYSGVIAKILSEDTRIRLVIIAARWANYTMDKPSEALERQTTTRIGEAEALVPGDMEMSRRVLESSLRRMIEVLVAAGKQVVLLGQVPPYATSPVACLVRARQSNGTEQDCFAPARNVRSLLDYSNNLLRSIADASNRVEAFLPSELLCNQALCSPFLNGVFLYRDDDHLSDAGSQQFSAYLADVPALVSLRTRGPRDAMP